MVISQLRDTLEHLVEMKSSPTYGNIDISKRFCQNCFGNDKEKKEYMNLNMTSV